MTSARYLMHRLAQLPIVLLFVSLGSFSLIHLTPGDPVTAMLGPYHSADVYNKLRTEYGLDRPFLVQYGRWVGRVLQGDLGRSIRTGEPILPLIPPRLAMSTFLAALTMGVTLLVAIPVGVLAAANHNRTPDYAAMLSTLVALSLPNFVLAIVLILVFGVHLQVLPISGIGERPLVSWESLKLLIMPAIALAAGRAAFLARLLRSSLLDILTQDYIKVARAKGLHEQRVLIRHALRNSLIPLINFVRSGICVFARRRGYYRRGVCHSRNGQPSRACGVSVGFSGNAGANSGCGVRIRRC